MKYDKVKATQSKKEREWEKKGGAETPCRKVGIGYKLADKRTKDDKTKVSYTKVLRVIREPKDKKTNDK